MSQTSPGLYSLPLAPESTKHLGTGPIPLNVEYGSEYFVHHSAVSLFLLLEGFASKVGNHCWIGSVQGAVATWSVIGMQYSQEFWPLMNGPGRYRSLY